MVRRPCRLGGPDRNFLFELDRNVSEQNDTMENLRAWLRDSHLLNRTGAGAAVAALGLATATPPSDAAFGLAALLALAGAVIRFWAAGIISKNRELATTGPYAYVRNPLYTGSMLIAIAFLLLNGNPWFVIPAIIGAIVLYMRTIESEEADLRELFGADFERYREQVPAIIPFKGRVDTGGSPVTYSLEQSLFNKEFNGVAGTLGMLALFYLYAHWIDEGTFRVTTTLAVIGLMAIRGSRRAAKERALAEKAAAAQAHAPVETSADPTPTDAPAPAAESHGEAESVAVDETPVDVAAPAAGGTTTPDEVPPITDTPPVAEADSTPPQDVVTVSDDVPGTDDGTTSIEVEPVSDTPQSDPESTPVSDDHLPEPEAHAEITEVELAKLVASDTPVAGGPDEVPDATPLAAPNEADSLDDADDDQRALLDQIDADEVADALGALELLDEGDERHTEKQDR